MARLPGKRCDVWKAVIKPGGEAGKPGRSQSQESLGAHAEEVVVYHAGTYVSFLWLPSQITKILVA